MIRVRIGTHNGGKTSDLGAKKNLYTSLLKKALT